MTWFVEDKRTWSQKLLGNILKSGHLPKHVAIIMDGNRRYARERHLKKIEGHRSGFEKLVEVNLLIILACAYAIYKFVYENYRNSGNFLVP